MELALRRTIDRPGHDRSGARAAGGRPRTSAVDIQRRQSRRLRLLDPSERARLEGPGQGWTRNHDLADRGEALRPSPGFDDGHPPAAPRGERSIDRLPRDL